MNLQTLKYILVILIISFLVYACANRGSGPTGGLKDTTPPKVMKSTPLNGSLNFKKKQVEIQFDEMVSIDKPTENVIISPPQQKPPDVKALGKNVVVNFNEDLTDSTTYSINFGNGIVDLNEKNALKNYMFSFSTGNEIDTLQVSGTVINSEDLNPVSGIMVGIYRESEDSVFFKKPFLRVGRTDESGHFVISNIKKGKYKIFALGDVNHDYVFQQGENLAMYDSMITPTFRREQMRDTIWKDSTEIDSIHTFMGTHYLPDDMVLRLFKENKKRQYFVKYERKEPFVFSIFFNAPAAKLPEFQALNSKWEGSYILQKNATNDSLTYWITDSLVWKTDTLQFKLTYLKSDSAFNLKPQTDTLNISMRKLRINTKAKKATKIKVEPLKFTTNTAGTFDLYNPIMLNFEAPLNQIDLSKIKLYLKVDTIYKQIQYKWRQTDSTKINYAIDYKWIPEKSYQLRIDSAAFRSIYDRISTKLKSEFKIRSLDEYSSVKLLLAKFNPKAVLQLLDAKDVVIATKPALEKGTLFQYLRPGTYYLRLYIDENGNGMWDTGELAKQLQPEQVYYYPGKLTLKANWDFEETWDYNQTPILQQKPAELKKAGANSKKQQY
ncbi:MAG: Ig-like domain-containing protein [Paludibacter sp.]